MFVEPMMTTIRAGSGPFLKHLNVHHAAHVIVTAEDDDFDEVFLQQLASEGFNVQYVAMGQDSAGRFADRIHAVANRMTGVSEHYAIVAFGDAASAILDTHTKSTPRLCALVAYYPGAIPDPAKTTYPMNTSILVHLADGTIGVRKTQEVLGLQGKRKTVRKRIDGGIGLGNQLELSFPGYRYPGVEAGFAEHDLDVYDQVAEDLAWTRTLQTLRDAFAMKVDLESVRDRHMEGRFCQPQHGRHVFTPTIVDLLIADADVEKNVGRALEATSAQAKVLYGPTMTGATSPKDLHRFYTEFFKPSPADLNARLLSRTIGTNRIVDEIHLSFKHDREIHWLLPGIPATNKRVQIILVSIVCIKGGLLTHERVYWDQASVLLQVGLLSYKNIPESFRKQGVEELPVMGAESVESTLRQTKQLNELIEQW